MSFSATLNTSAVDCYSQVKVCDICGDPGFEDCLAHCSQCNDGAEHSYCMWTLLDTVPLDWVCERCKTKDKDDNGKKRLASVVDSSLQASIKKIDWKTCRRFSLNISDVILALPSTKNPANTIVEAVVAKALGKKAEASTHHCALTSKGKSSSQTFRTHLVDSRAANVVVKEAGVAAKSLFQSECVPKFGTSRGDLLSHRSKFASAKPASTTSDMDQTSKLKLTELASTTSSLGQVTKSHLIKSDCPSSSSKIDLKLVNLEGKSGTTGRLDLGIPSQGASMNNKPGLSSYRTLSKSSSFRLENNDLPFLLPSKTKDFVRSSSANGRLCNAGGNVREIGSANQGYQTGNRDCKSFSGGPLVGDHDRTSENTRGENARALEKLAGSKLSSAGVSRVASLGTTSSCCNSSGGSKGDGAGGANWKQTSYNVPPTTCEPTRLIDSPIGTAKVNSASDNLKERGLFVRPNGCPLENTKESHKPEEGPLKKKLDERPKKEVRFADMSSGSNSCLRNASIVARTSAKSSESVADNKEKQRLRVPAHDGSVRGIVDASIVARTSTKSSKPVADNKEKPRLRVPAHDGNVRGIIEASGPAKLAHVDYTLQGSKPRPQSTRRTCAPQTVDLPSSSGGNMDLFCGKPPSELQAMPDLHIAWSGCFNVFSSTPNPICYKGMQAHPSNLADPKVYEAAKVLPFRLCLEEMIRGVHNDSWPKSFQDFPPNSKSIGIYFFPVDMHSHDTWYKPLIKHMVAKDLVLRASLEFVQLLVLPSQLLPEVDRCWDGMEYLWGFFRPNKQKASKQAMKMLLPGLLPVSLPSLPAAERQDAGIDLVSPAANGCGEVIDMEIDMVGGEDC